MDGTISLGYEPFNIQRDFVLAVLSKMRFGPQATQLGIIQFSDRWSTSVEMEIGRHGRQTEVLKNVSNIVYQRGMQTMTGLAMHLGYEQVFHTFSNASFEQLNTKVAEPFRDGWEALTKKNTFSCRNRSYPLA